MPTQENMSETLRSLIDTLEGMHHEMGEGPYMHAHATAHEQFRSLGSDAERNLARLHVQKRPALQLLISFP